MYKPLLGGIFVERLTNALPITNTKSSLFYNSLDNGKGGFICSIATFYFWSRSLWYCNVFSSTLVDGII
jgi:hypothetical protein